MRALGLMLLAGLLLFPGVARAQLAGAKSTAKGAAASEPLEPARINRGAAAVDVLVVRPLAFAVLPIGVALFVPTALLSAPGGLESVETAMERFVTEPANYVFTRPLGEF